VIHRGIGEIVKPGFALLALIFVGSAFAQNGTQPPPKGAVPTCRGEATDPTGCITPPHAIYSPNPTYDDASREAKVEGTVRLSIIVTPDGLVKKPTVVKSLSEGLDKRAMETVAQWKFVPATRDGKPVGIAIQVECTFKLK
jgi:protein TonB